MDDGCQDLDEQLERRRSNSKRIISLAAQARRRSSNPSDSDGEHFVETRKRIESGITILLINITNSIYFEIYMLVNETNIFYIDIFFTFDV